MKSMNILPMNRTDADKHHWVVRCLRYYGYFITTICLIVGFIVGSENVSQMILQSSDWPKFLIVALSTVILGDEQDIQ